MVERKRFKLHEIRVAAVTAMHEGKAEIFVPEKGALVLSWHPLSRLSPNVDGDGFALVENETQE